MTVDVGSTSFSFLITVIALADREAEQKFKTAGITTEHKTALVPTTGLAEIYQIHEMQGVARSVIVPLSASQTGGGS